MNSQQTRWPMFQHVERRANRLAEMITHLDVDPVKLVRQRSGEAYAEARTNCLHCNHAQACLFWLEAGGTEAGLKSGPSEFCPNFETFLSCRRDSN